MVSRSIEFLDEEPAGSDQIAETFRLVQAGLEGVSEPEDVQPFKRLTVIGVHEEIGHYTGIARLIEVDFNSDENHSGLVGVAEVGKLNEYLLLDADTSNFPMLMGLSHDIKTYYMYAQRERMAMRMTKRTSAADIEIDYFSEAERLIFTHPDELLGSSIVNRREIGRLNGNLKLLARNTEPV